MRTQRVSELLRAEISNILSTRVKDPKVKDVVITGIEVYKDLSTAKIFFTTYTKESLNNILKGLNRSSGFIRGELIKTLRMRKVPKLEFFIDSASDYGDKIDQILKDLDIPEEDERDS